MAFTLPPLPYALNALAPHISEKTLEFHYGKHHQAYVTNLNKLTEGTTWSDLSLEEIIQKSHKTPGAEGIFNNAAQVWNHTFLWHSMTPHQGGGAPKGVLADKIAVAFGDYDTFRTQFHAAAVSQFGSGWAWLVADPDGRLHILKTGNAETPLTQGGVTPLLTCDVWEHAYYLDYQNRRPDYVATFLDSLVNWSFAEQNLAY